MGNQARNEVVTAAGITTAVVVGSAVCLDVCGPIVVAAGRAIAAGLGLGQAACADGDCTNEINVTARIGQRVWDLGNKVRGDFIERALGKNTPPKMPTIDIWNAESGIATSIKSLNLNDPSYQRISAITSRLVGYVNDLYTYTGTSPQGYQGVVVNEAAIVQRQILLAIPPGASAAQLAEIQRISAWAQTVGVQIVTQVVK